MVISLAPGIGPRTALRLHEHFGSPAAVLSASRSDLGDLGLKPPALDWLKHPDRAAIDSVLSWAERPGAHLLGLDDPRYPPLLREIADPPPLLYVRGDIGLLSEPQIAVVGSRNPSPGGREITAELVRELARCGLVVTSGLAFGIDGVAHEAALETGQSIAVLGTGPDLVYPSAHVDLACRIVERGALVTELPPGRGPQARNFPRRNRLISGLSLGVLVTEAALKSGSLITARSALEQGREVFAVPGPIGSPLSRGCHALIRDGARLVETAADILSELAPQLRGALDSDASPDASGEGLEPAGLEGDERLLWEALGFDQLAPDELIARTGLPAEQVLSMLLLMELNGHVSSLPGGRYCRASG
ncbi:DNA-processing protein DprA [Imhoffiella purpurea]|uniref:DNA-processing protein DprA n=1 Tax=Imhoffiella purpurea TaxID=1249627 RepID=UPI0005C18FA9|nr:DNA-processing protein DprA [Imhoffiella purpurea]